MAAVLTGFAETGLPSSGAGAAGFVRRRKSDGAFWNTSGTPAFETYAAGNIAQYFIAATETGATGLYTAADPDPTTEGDYWLIKRVGVNLAQSDLAVGMQWEGEAGADALAARTRVETALPDAAPGSGLGGGLPTCTIGVTGDGTVISQKVLVSTSGKKDIWNTPTSGMTTAGGIGKRLLDLFLGITGLASWLGAGMGKTADATTLAEINATTAGASYDNTKDSPEALRDRGDSGAWGASGDPLTNAVPGAYLHGTAGFKLGLLGTVGATYPDDVPAPGELGLVCGDTYSAALGNRKPFTSPPGFPDPAGKTVMLGVGLLNSNDVLFTTTADSVAWDSGTGVVSPLFPFTAAQTALLDPEVGRYGGSWEVDYGAGLERTGGVFEVVVSRKYSD